MDQAIYLSRTNGAYDTRRFSRGTGGAESSRVASPGISAALNPTPIALLYNARLTVNTGNFLIDRFTYTVPRYRRAFIQTALTLHEAGGATGAWFSEITLLRAGLKDTVVFDVTPVGTEPRRANAQRIAARHRYGGFFDGRSVIANNNGQIEMLAGDTLHGSTHWQAGGGSIHFILSVLAVEYNER